MSFWKLSELGLSPSIIILSSLLLICNTNLAQNCENVGFENGNYTGYELYEGQISSGGIITFNTFPSHDKQFKLMMKGGFDRVAFENCKKNKMLPVVSPNGGMFSMMIGDSTDKRGKAAMARLKLKVTKELSFFLLRYAVILNDPGHATFQQPRFEIRIKDEFGKLLPCGEYSVHAGRNLPGFESCDDNWRVRPWTSAGFLLTPFINQTITIEIMVTDCTRKGHAGYAYIDAQCMPLEFNLEVNCAGTSGQLSVSEGFDQYLWSTGATTRVITIPKLVKDSTYTLTITSVTGCEYQISYTVPYTYTGVQPKFGPYPDQVICHGDKIWIKPRGKALFNVYCPQLAYAADSFLVSPDTTTIYKFIAKDSFNCKSDSMEVKVTVTDLRFHILRDSVICQGAESTLQIDNPRSDCSYYWMPFNQSATSLKTKFDSSVTIIVQADNGASCLAFDTLVIDINSSKLSNQVVQKDTTCCKDDKLWIHPLFFGGYKIEWKDQQLVADSILITAITNDQFTFITRDSNLCKADTMLLTIHVIEPVVKMIADSVFCAGEEYYFRIENPVSNARYTWLPEGHEGNEFHKKLDTTAIIIVKVDYPLGCQAFDTLTANVRTSLHTNQSIHTDTSLCFGEQLWIYPRFSGPTKVYSVENDLSLDSILVVAKASTNLTFISKDSTGCKADTQYLSLMVINTDFNIVGDSLVCGHELYTFSIDSNTNGKQFTWMYDGSNHKTLQLKIDTTTSIIARVDFNANCFSFDTLVIHVRETKLSNKAITKDTILCSYNSIWIHPEFEGVHFLHKESGLSGDSILINPNLDNHFTFISTDSTRCGADTLYLNTEVYLAEFNITGDSLLCAGHEYHLWIENPGADTKYKWLNTSYVGNDFTSLLDSTETIIVQSMHSSGCMATDTFVIFERKSDLTNLKLSLDTTICKGDSILLRPVIKGSHKLLNLHTNTISDSIYLSPDFSIDYTLLTLDSSACKADTLDLHVVVEDIRFDITGSEIVCPGKENEFSISNPEPEVSYHWYPSGNTGSSIRLVVDSTTIIKVKAMNSLGCAAEDSLIVYSKRQVPFHVNTSPDTLICEGSELVLRVTGEGLGKIQWLNLNQTGSSVSIKPLHDQLYKLEVSDNAECDTIYASINVDVISPPRIELGDPICTHAEIELDARVLNKNTKSWYKWNWDDGSTTPIKKITSSGLYSVEVSNECGLIMDSVWVQFDDFKVFIPNAFTPNDDGVNDFFKPVVIEWTKNQFHYEFKIFDRWGTLVYSSEDLLNLSWDGNFKGLKCQPGVYVWYLAISKLYPQNIICNEPPIQMGDVTLIR